MAVGYWSIVIQTDGNPGCESGPEPCPSCRCSACHYSDTKFSTYAESCRVRGSGLP